MGRKWRQNALGFVKRNPRTVGFTAGFLVVAVLVASIVHSLDSPAYGTITPPKPEKQKNAPSPKTYEGKSVSFRYPATYVVISTQKSGNDLEDIRLATVDSTDRAVKDAVITIYRGTLVNDSGVNFRRLHPTIYKESDSNDALVFSKSQDGSEYTGFMAHDGDVASVSLTAALNNRELGTDYRTIADSWQWK
ncbi:MAG TPA: hypothetical protein VLG27_03070 [Candidatus Saccharimonadia bacterium]|nr:hypothetical protein [Candidatus Saccharimonadia bacterium]